MLNKHRASKTRVSFCQYRSFKWLGGWVKLDGVRRCYKRHQNPSELFTCKTIVHSWCIFFRIAIWQIAYYHGRFANCFIANYTTLDFILLRSWRITSKWTTTRTRLTLMLVKWFGGIPMTPRTIALLPIYKECSMSHSESIYLGSPEIQVIWKTVKS